LKTALVTDP